MELVVKCDPGSRIIPSRWKIPDLHMPIKCENTFSKPEPFKITLDQKQLYKPYIYLSFPSSYLNL